MRLDTFHGRTLPYALAAARAALGDDAMIVRTRVRRDGDAPLAEVVATTAAEVERLRSRLEPDPLPLAGSRGRGRPLTVALVGPTGAGKTTTIAKLAVHPRAFGGRRVGLLTLDTYRVGALEQLSTFAEIAGLPLEVAYQVGDLIDARKRLASCDVILVDTPGRSPRAKGRDWIDILAALDPDEVHLVLPAPVRVDLAEAVRDGFRESAPTHLLLSKLDEVPGEAGVAELAMAVNLPARWVTDGQEVPADLRVASPRILAALGLAPEAARGVA